MTLLIKSLNQWGLSSTHRHYIHVRTMALIAPETDIIVIAVIGLLFAKTGIVRTIGDEFHVTRRGRHPRGVAIGP